MRRSQISLQISKHKPLVEEEVEEGEVEVVEVEELVAIQVAMEELEEESEDHIRLILPRQPQTL